MIILTESEIEKLLEMGRLAPSAGNAQPWRILVKPNSFEVILEEKRASKFLNTGKLISFFGIGCFVKNVTITADTLGLSYKIEYLDDLGVKLLFLDRNKPRPNNLFHVIPKRVTNRQLSDGSVLPDKEIEILEKSVNTTKECTLHMISTYKQKREIANAIGVADKIRILHDELFQEMMDEFRWNETETIESKNGLDLKTLELPKNLNKMFLLLKTYPFIRNILPENTFEQLGKPLVIGCSHFACLSIKGEINSESIIKAGMCMENLWLTATERNLDIHPWTVATFLLMQVELFQGKNLSDKQIEEITFMGDKMRKVFGISKKNMPLLLFRISRSKPPSARSLRLLIPLFVQED